MTLTPWIGRSVNARRLTVASWLALSLNAISVPARAADPMTPTPVSAPQQAVDALNKISGGPHAGYRANHAKGILVMGTFQPASTAKALSKAPHFATSVPVIVRFSNATGLPTLSDADPNASPHGIAIRFQLPGGSSTDIVSISANGFPVATPEDFVSLLQAVGQSGLGVPKPTPIERFLEGHPAALKFVSTQRPRPVSFATLAFYGVNAFKFKNSKSEIRYARYQILPTAGEHALTDAQAAQAARDYLMNELPRRIAKGAVTFRVVAQLANKGDLVNDPTVVWPADRELVELGVLRLTKTAPEQTKAQRALLFNPLTLPAGIEPSDDPVLLFRPGAYAVSYLQRLP